MILEHFLFANHKKFKKVAGGAPPTAVCLGGCPHQPQDGKQKFYFLNSFLLTIKICAMNNDSPVKKNNYFEGKVCRSRILLMKQQAGTTWKNKWSMNWKIFF